MNNNPSIALVSAGFALALLVLHYLQAGCHPPVVPSLQRRFPDILPSSIAWEIAPFPPIYDVSDRKIRKALGSCLWGFSGTTPLSLGKKRFPSAQEVHSPPCGERNGETHTYELKIPEIKATSPGPFTSITSFLVSRKPSAQRVPHYNGAQLWTVSCRCCPLTLLTLSMPYLQINKQTNKQTTHKRTNSLRYYHNSTIKASCHVVFGGIQRYYNTLAQPYGNTRIKFWIPGYTLNTNTGYCE